MAPGSKWYKFDIHTHTPYSYDYAKLDPALKSITPKEWLRHFIDEGIQCIAITDHNSGAAIDPYKSAAEDLRNQGVDITIFPGVEITVQGGVHILAIFDPSKTSADIASLLGAVEYLGEQGKSDRVTELSPKQVIKMIHKHDGVAIPAHIDMDAGYCKQLTGKTLEQALTGIDAVEVIDLTSETLKSYQSYNIGTPKLIGSDSHHPCKVGRAFCWLKMDTPNINGLRNALIDGASSVIRSDSETTHSPNQMPSCIINTLHVENTKYFGTQKPLEIHFNPWLNSIIGGRGTGKSSIVEFMRISLRRENELSQHYEINRSFRNVIQIPERKDDPGLFKENTKLSIYYTKNGEVYRITWTNQKAEIHKQQGAEWIAEDGVIAERFPVRIFSQKQIFEISKNTNTLLNLIDNSTEIDLTNWNIDLKRELSNYKNLKNTISQHNIEITNKSKFEGDRADIISRISQLEKLSNNPALALYQRLDSVRCYIRGHQPGTISTIKNILNTIESIRPLCISDYVKGASIAEKEVHKRLLEIDNTLTESKELTRKAMEEALNTLSEFPEWFDNSDFMQKLCSTVPDVQKSINAENQFGQQYLLVTELEKIEINLTKIKELEDQRDILFCSLSESEDKLIKLRQLITSRRQHFISLYFSDIESIRVNILPFEDLPTSLMTFSKIFEDHNKPKTIYTDYHPYIKDTISHLISRINKAKNNSEKIKEIKEFKKNLLSGEIFGKPVPDYIQGKINYFKDEIEINILQWFPEDKLEISFKENDRKFRSIANASAGQRSAAILSLILALGSEPLILDQPEDDLDNKLIGTLIVERLKMLKTRRQVIIATHNANIVVNGDSELIIALANIKGQSYINTSGALQDNKVKNNICEIMEGGRELFEKRYKRILNV